jgi:hypothetical protein
MRLDLSERRVDACLQVKTLCSVVGADSSEEHIASVFVVLL